MKRILLILMVLASVAHAELGWTLDQCRQHYGPNKEKRGMGADYVTEFRTPIHGLPMVLEVWINAAEDTVYKIEYFTGTPGRLPCAIVNAILKDNASQFKSVKQEMHFAHDDGNFYDSLTISIFYETNWNSSGPP